MARLIDKKSGRQLHSGDWIERKDYKGFIRRYELLSLSDAEDRIQVRELDHEDRWLYHSFSLNKIGIERSLV